MKEEKSKALYHLIYRLKSELAQVLGSLMKGFDEWTDPMIDFNRTGFCLTARRFI